ncbi:MAG: hypothetical protein H0W20_00800 [Chthoniobacterales bacterium]|nr:hypothetical protein [Chthoniobacterales bacterium]
MAAITHNDVPAVLEMPRTSSAPPGGVAGSRKPEINNVGMSDFTGL